VINEEDPELVNELVDGVRAYVHEQLGDETTLPLSVTARDDNGELIGGVSGRTIYRNFLIGVVWVDKKFRGTGLGRQLDTLSIQAPVFYQKLGFEIVGTVPGFPGSPERYFLLKTF